MAGVELATAYVSIVPESSKIAPHVRKEFGQVEKDAATAGDRSGKSLGKRMSGAIGASLKAGAIGVAAGAAAIAGTALVKGFSRLRAIDEAEAKLRGLGYTATDISGIMDSVTAAVTGTAFGLDEAATASASALASGIKPGKELEQYLRLIGDAATQGGASFNEMASIINKTTATGKVGMENLNQLSERGIGIMSWLADEYGVTGAELSKMVSAGEVDVKTFRKVLNDNIGGAALESGATFTGSLANMQAALGRLGAKVLSGAFAQLPAVFSNLGGALDKLGPYAERAGSAIGGAFSSGLSAIQSALSSINWGAVRSAFAGIAAVAAVLAGQFRDQLVPAVTKFGKMVAANVMPVVRAVVPALASIGATIASVVIPGISGLIGLVTQFEGILVPVAAGILAIVAAMKVYGVVMATVAAIKKAYIAVQAALNLVMAMNPIGLLVLALIGLGTALVVAYKKSETFRNIVDKAWAAIKAVTLTVFNAVRGAVSKAFAVMTKIFMNFTGPGLIIKHWDTIKSATTAAWNAVVSAISGAVSRIIARAKAMLDFVTSIPSKIKGAMSGLGSLLYDAGVSIIQGLWNGLKAKWEAVKNWFAEKTKSIPDLKGPARTDRRLLVNAGTLVMAGFEDGLRAGSRGPLGFLSDITSGIGAMGPGAPAGASVAGLSSDDIAVLADALYVATYNGVLQRDNESNFRDRANRRINR